MLPISHKSTPEYIIITRLILGHQSTINSSTNFLHVRVCRVLPILPYLFPFRWLFAIIIVTLRSSNSPLEGLAAKIFMSRSSDFEDWLVSLIYLYHSFRLFASPLRLIFSPYYYAPCGSVALFCWAVVYGLDGVPPNNGVLLPWIISRRIPVYYSWYLSRPIITSRSHSPSLE